MEHRCSIIIFAMLPSYVRPAAAITTVQSQRHLYRSQYCYNAITITIVTTKDTA